jgi:hypothetical protein
MNGIHGISWQNILYLAESPPSRVNVALGPKLCTLYSQMITDADHCNFRTLFLGYVIAVISMTLDICGIFWRS